MTVHQALLEQRSYCAGRSGPPSRKRDPLQRSAAGKCARAQNDGIGSGEDEATEAHACICTRGNLPRVLWT